MWYEGMGYPPVLQGLWRVALGVLGAFLAVLCLAGLLATSAWPRMHAGPGVMDGGRRLGGVVAPLDGFSTPSGAYSFRKLRSAYAGPAVRIRRVSDNLETDIGFVLGLGAPWDEAAALAHCAATTCFVRTWYDQSGIARDLPQATAAYQPQLIFNCVAGKPCLEMTLALQNLASAAWTPTAPVSLSRVSARTAGTGSCIASTTGTTGNRIINLNPDGHSLNGVSGSIMIMTGDTNFHVLAGVVAGAASTLVDDGVTQTGTVTANVAAGDMGLLGSNSATCRFVEFIAWGDYALSAAEVAALTANQRAYWFPLPLDNIAQPAAAYSFRKLRSAYAGPAVRLRRASDNAELDIGWSSFVPGTGAPLDTAAANAHCAATTCSVVTWYDQSGLARHVTMGNSAQQPAYIANCQGALPCARTTTNQIMVGPSVTPAAGPASFAAVARTDAGAAVCAWIMAGVQQFGANGGSWLLYNGGAHGAPAALTVWHAGSGVINSAASVINIDGVEAAGSIAPVTTAGAILVAQGDGAQPCSYAEAVWWNNYALTAGERAALVANQRGFWGF